MQRENNNPEITFLVEDLEAILEMNKLLEKENQELKHEIGRLKLQISALKAHDIERKTTLWKKIQYSSNQNDDKIQEKKIVGIQEEEKRSPKPPVAPPQGPPLPPPAPPPLPSKSLIGSKLAVRRMPEVIEFYRYLSKRNAQLENRTNVLNSIHSGEGNNARNMIGEIEKGSRYLIAVKSDVETQKEFINYLIQEVETASFTEISEVEAFVKWVDGELSSLVDERAVLKHFPHWPERKADALREASCCYRDLKNIESQVLSYKDNPKQPWAHTLRRIEELQDRLERVINNLERMREGICKRYKELRIPWNWMLDTGLVGQIKLRSLRLAKEYMERVIRELQSSRCSTAEDIIHQGARFAYRIHQFAGGFDLDAKQLFEELKRVHSTNPNE